MRPTLERVRDELSRHRFAVLSTVDEHGSPDSAGVNYHVSGSAPDLTIYVMTRRHLKKARNIERNPRVALVVPLTRRVLRFLPPATIQLRGRATLLDWTDEAGIAAFRRSWIGRRILSAYAASRRRGETRVCFVKITPDPIARTYMVGTNVLELAGHMEAGAATVHLG